MTGSGGRRCTVRPDALTGGRLGRGGVAAAVAVLEVPVIRFRTIASSRKMPKTMLVAQVSTSPVLVPNAVLPPAAAERAGKPAAAALLDQHQQDQEDGRR